MTMANKRKKTDNERKEFERAVAAALQKVAACGVDISGFAPKSAVPLLQLVKAVDDCLADGRRHRREAAKFRVNPTNLEAYGVKRSTINANPMFRSYVRYHEDQMDCETVTLTRGEYNAVCDELKRLRVYQENAISLGLQNQRLLEELEAVRREKNEAIRAYKELSNLIGENQDFNKLLQ